MDSSKIEKIFNKTGLSENYTLKVIDVLTDKVGQEMVKSSSSMMEVYNEGKKICDEDCVLKSYDEWFKDYVGHDLIKLRDAIIEHLNDLVKYTIEIKEYHIEVGDFYIYTHGIEIKSNDGSTHYTVGISTKKSK